jgi:hypothetical protein
LFRDAVMAETDTEGKGSGTSKAGSIAIATALIGAVTTISVAYINKGSPAAEVKPAPVATTAAAPNAEPAAQPAATQPVTAEEPIIPPQPLMQTTHNVGGIWNAAGGEQMEIRQSGSQLVVNTGVMTENGPVLVQGYGRINERKLNWTAQAAGNGGQIEIECVGRLTTNGNSIQGTCDVMGQQLPFQYTR